MVVVRKVVSGCIGEVLKRGCCCTEDVANSTVRVRVLVLVMVELIKDVAESARTRSAADIRARVDKKNMMVKPIDE